MPQALPLTNMISQTAVRVRKPRLLSAQFNDGYSQEAPDGLNPLHDTWSLTYENLSLTDRETLWTALDEVGSWDYFTWTPHGDSGEKKWKVTKDGVQESVNSVFWTISFELRQVF